MFPLFSLSGFTKDTDSYETVAETCDDKKEKIFFRLSEIAKIP